MLKLNKLFRGSYTGEDVIASRTLQDGVWRTVTEFVPSNVSNKQISNRAVVFGNGIHRKDFDMNLVLNKRSGLLGRYTLQTYACNAFYREYTPDFLVVTDRRIAHELSTTNFVRDNIVYTRVDTTLEFPRLFYLIPHDVYADAGTTALCIAAFDGHKRIYMIGFDGQDTPGRNNNIYAGTNGYDAVDATVTSDKWTVNRKMLFDTYDDVDFVYVSQNGRMRVPQLWKECVNFRQISYRNFVLEADL